MAEVIEEKKYLGQAAVERLVEKTKSEINDGDERTLDDANAYTDSIVTWGEF